MMANIKDERLEGEIEVVGKTLDISGVGGSNPLAVTSLVRSILVYFSLFFCFYWDLSIEG